MSDENPYRAPRTKLGPRGIPERIVGEPTSKRYSVDCSCGRRIDVGASQAGTKLTCECGLEVAVPSLSKLRASTGADPYEVSAADTIRRMIAEGQLPAGDVCELSGKPTDDVLELYVLVTREFMNQGRKWRYLFLAAFVSWIFYFVYLASGKVVPAAGSETAIPTPIRLSARYHKRMRKASQWRLRRLLRRIPIYAELLKDNPEGRIVADLPHRPGS